MVTINPPIIVPKSLLHWQSRSLRVASTALPACALLLVLVVSLSRNLFYPMGTDQALYQFIAERVIAGQRLYVDVWDQNWPGIVGIHWLATILFGGTELGLRLFDACWQGLTLIALITLGRRDRDSWSLGLVAALIYALTYYGMGFLHTAQREGFASLPLLLALHAVIPGRNAPGTGRRLGLLLAGGAAGFIPFAIKPTLGLCYGFLWIYLLASCRQQRHKGMRIWAEPVAFSLGFVISAAAAVGLLIHIDAWSGFVPVLTRQGVPGYVLGPGLIREITPHILLGLLLLLTLVWFLRPALGMQSNTRLLTGLYHLDFYIYAAVIFGLIMISHWFALQQVALRVSGLLILVIGTILVTPWRGRSIIWRLCLLLAIGCFAGMVLQGWFFFYQFGTFFLFCSYLAANELFDRFSQRRVLSREKMIWTAICLACVVQLSIDHWGSKMLQESNHCSVLSEISLDEYRTAITRRQHTYPQHRSITRTAQRIKELTGPNDPIGCLLVETRLYHFAQRPPVYKLVLPQLVYGHMFDEFMAAIAEKKPKVLVARIPEELTHETDRARINAAIMDWVKEYYGDNSEVVRTQYQVTEVIDDLCILQPENQNASPCQNSK